jgi:hypothetical protein
MSPIASGACTGSTSSILTRSSRLAINNSLKLSTAQATVTATAKVTRSTVASCGGSKSKLPVITPGNKPPVDDRQPKQQQARAPSSVAARERKSSVCNTGQKIVAKKKRNSVTSQHVARAAAAADDNDHDEDSSDDHSSNQIVRIATENPRAKGRVSFQLNNNNNNSSSSEANKTVAKRSGKTPPHKKFRKLRLFDTPQTPKTLIKKAQPIVEANNSSATVGAESQQPIQSVNAKKSNKKLLTANEVIKAVVKSSPVVNKKPPKVKYQRQNRWILINSS